MTFGNDQQNVQKTNKMEREEEEEEPRRGGEIKISCPPASAQHVTPRCQCLQEAGCMFPGRISSRGCARCSNLINSEIERKRRLFSCCVCVQLPFYLLHLFAATAPVGECLKTVFLSQHSAPLPSFGRTSLLSRLGSSPTSARRLLIWHAATNQRLITISARIKSTSRLSPGVHRAGNSPGSEYMDMDSVGGVPSAPACRRRRRAESRSETQPIINPYRSHL